MSEQAAIYARFGFDLKGAKQDLAEASNMVGKAHGKMAEAAHGNSKAHEGLLENERRVENKMVGLAGNLANATSASDALASSVDALGDSLNLSLGAGIAVGAAVAIFTALSAAVAEARTLNAEILAMTEDKGSPDFQNAGELEARLTANKDKLAAILKDRGGWKDAKQFLGEAFSGDTSDMAGRLRDQAAALMAAIEQGKADIAAKAAKVTEVKSLEAEGDERGAALAKIRIEYAEKLGAAYKAQNVPLAEQLKQQQALDEKSANRNADKKEIEDVAKAKAKLQAEIEAGNKVGLENAAKEKALKDAAAKAERENDYKLAAAKKKELQEWLESAERIRKENVANEKAAVEKRIADELSARKKADDAAAAHRKQTLADAVDAQLAGPDARRQAKREKGARDRATKKVERKDDLEKRGGVAAADVPKDELFGTPFESRLRVLGGRGPAEAAKAGSEKNIQSAIKSAIQDAKIFQDINSTIGSVRNARA